MSLAVSPDRCPACDAVVSDGSPWCTLCYADLRPEPVTAYAVALNGLAGSAAPLDTEGGEKAGEPAATWPCTSCQTDVGFAEERCPYCGAGFLATIAEPAGGVRVPVLGDLGALSRRARLTAGLAIAPLVAALTLALAAIAGLVL